MVHPWDMEWWCPKEYWQPWLVGMPSETTLAGTAFDIGRSHVKIPLSPRDDESRWGEPCHTLKGRIDWGYSVGPILLPHTVQKCLQRC